MNVPDFQRALQEVVLEGMQHGADGKQLRSPRREAWQQLPALRFPLALGQIIVCFANIARVHGVRLQVDVMLRLCTTAELPHW